jgi:hypothetical protein
MVVAVVVVDADADGAVPWLDENCCSSTAVGDVGETVIVVCALEW